MITFEKFIREAVINDKPRYDGAAAKTYDSIVYPDINDSGFATDMWNSTIVKGHSYIWYVPTSGKSANKLVAISLSGQEKILGTTYKCIELQELTPKNTWQTITHMPFSFATMEDWNRITGNNNVKADEKFLWKLGAALRGKKVIGTDIQKIAKKVFDSMR